jgi:hypothetical protein
MASPDLGPSLLLFSNFRRSDALPSIRGVLRPSGHRDALWDARRRAIALRFAQTAMVMRVERDPEPRPH